MYIILNGHHNKQAANTLIFKAKTRQYPRIIERSMQEASQIVKVAVRSVRQTVQNLADPGASTAASSGGKLYLLFKKQPKKNA